MSHAACCAVSSIRKSVLTHLFAEHVLASLLPTEMSEGTPTAFTTVGHIAHLNLRDEYLPYRFIIGGTILDKNPGIRTVVNKLDSIDEKFRFFKMELLAGEADYQATVVSSAVPRAFTQP